MKTIIKSIIIISFFCSVNLFAQSAVVIINKSNSQPVVQKEELRKIYLGKKEMWNDGTRIILSINSSDNSTASEKLFNNALEMDITKFRKHWLKKVFSGNGIKPTEFSDDNKIIEFVNKNSGAVGVIDEKNLTDQVKVLMKFN